jgi:3-oxoacyl-[acyl-carrier protein] reductase
MLLTQLSLPHMEARGWGRIVFNSSVAAFEGGSVGPHDAAAKAALHGFVYWVGASVAGKGVTVNAVAPAGVGGEGVGVGMGMGMERSRCFVCLGRDGGLGRVRARVGTTRSGEMC